MAKDLEGTQLKKMVTRSLWKKDINRHFELAKDMKVFVSYVNAHRCHR